MSANLAIAAAAALMGVAALRLELSKSKPRWLHGTLASRCASIERDGYIKASASHQRFPTLKSIINEFRASLNQLDLGGVPSAEDADELIERVLSESATPMRGFAYAVMSGDVGRRYLKFNSWMGDCIYEVKLTPGVLVVPDEDWLGALLVKRMDHRQRAAPPRSGLHGDPGFLVWWDRLSRLVPENSSWYIEESLLVEEFASYLQGESLELYAAVGRDLISHLLDIPGGQELLAEGAMKYAPSIAHGGPMKVVRRYHFKDYTA